MCFFVLLDRSFEDPRQLQAADRRRRGPRRLQAAGRPLERKRTPVRLLMCDKEVKANFFQHI